MRGVPLQSLSKAHSCQVESAYCFVCLSIYCGAIMQKMKVRRELLRRRKTMTSLGISGDRLIEDGIRDADANNEVDV